MMRYKTKERGKQENKESVSASGKYNKSLYDKSFSDKSFEDCGDKKKSKEKDWYRPPKINSPGASTFKKLAAIVFTLIILLAMLLMALGKITWVEFWLTVIFCAVFAWLVLPKMR